MGSVIYASSYDRGLECLLNMWPKVLEQDPEAKLDIYYGWDTFDAVHSKDPEQMKWKWGIIRKLNDLRDSVTEHGRVTHAELAEAMKKAKVHCYPSEFTEINMITMLKVLAAGCIPVTTGVGAVIETQGKFGYTVRCDDIYTNEDKQEDFIDAIIKALKQEDYDSAPQKEWVKQFFWTEIAKQWDKVLGSDSREKSKSL